MVPPILTTKLYVPPPPPQVLIRPRLLDRLNDGLRRKLTLISAPAGFGKTTLLSAWAATGNITVAWLALDSGDGDLARFLTYLVAALRTVAPTIGADVLRVLQSPQPPPPEPILTALLNDIAALPSSLVLVLDDYHLIDAAVVDQALTFLVEHLPPQLHLVIATREDPQLPLARLRARGQLAELRAADLRFTPAEAAGFLRAMGLHLTAQDIAALESRTEGWIAGLQLAALSLQNQPDVTTFIRAFAGSHRYIMDYLVEEVLQHQPAAVRSFLLQTSILDRLCGPLCDAVTGWQASGDAESSQARLEALERGNFFVVPLDDQRHWYRYHHLFAEVLHAHLLASTAGQPGELAALHRRASAWYAQHGFSADAIRHALAAGDFEHAAALIERAVPALRQGRQEAAALGWLKALPDDLLRDRPVLCGAYAWALLATGQFASVEEWLRKIEYWLDAPADSATTGAKPDRRMVVVNQEEFRQLPGSVAVWRAGQALALGDVDATITYAQRVLALASADDHLRRGAGAGFLGLAWWSRGDLEAAHQAYAECMARIRTAGYLSDSLGSAIALADIGLAQGRLHDAMRTYTQALQFAQEQGDPPLRGTADLYVGLGELHLEWNDLTAAAAALHTSQELGDFAGLPQCRYRRCVAMSRLLAAEGNLSAALDQLDEAERVYAGDFFPNVRPIPALKARLWLAQGRLAEALAWVRERGLSVADDLAYLREFEHITLARVLLAAHKTDPAAYPLPVLLAFLYRLRDFAQAGGHTASVIEILLLQSLAHQAQADAPAALAALQQALALAAPEGYIRLSIDEAPGLAPLLRAAAAQGILPRYTAKLLAALPTAQPPDQPEPAAAPFPATPPITTRSLAVHRPAQPLLDPLSERELEVLRLFPTELSGPEIAHELVIALSTLRTHTKSIYSKLDVNSRRAAVTRAAELGLL